MPHILASSSGRIPDAFIKNSYGAFQNTNSAQRQGEKIGQKLKLGSIDTEILNNELKKAIREGKGKDIREVGTPVYDRYEPSIDQESEGKTIVNNQMPGGITVRHGIHKMGR